jgi:hypothetical protein
VRVTYPRAQSVSCFPRVFITRSGVRWRRAAGGFGIPLGPRATGKAKKWPLLPGGRRRRRNPGGCQGSTSNAAAHFNQHSGSSCHLILRAIVYGWDEAHVRSVALPCTFCDATAFNARGPEVWKARLPLRCPNARVGATLFELEILAAPKRQTTHAHRQQGVKHLPRHGHAYVQHGRTSTCDTAPSLHE